MGPPPRPIGLQQQYADRTYGFRDIQRTRTSAGSNVKASLRSSSFASVRASQRANTNENGTRRRDLQGSNNGYGTPPGFGRPINGQQKLPIMPGNAGINEQQQQQQEEDSSPVPMTFAPRPIPVIINPVQQQKDPSPAPITNVDDEAQRPTPVITKPLPGIGVYADVVPITDVTQPEQVVVDDKEDETKEEQDVINNSNGYDESPRQTPVITKYLPGGIQVYADVVPITEVTQPERVVVQDGEDVVIGEQEMNDNSNGSVMPPGSGRPIDGQQKLPIMPGNVQRPTPVITKPLPGIGVYADVVPITEV